MEQLNLEMRHGNEHGVFRDTYPIDRPDGFDDEEYTIHAQKAAELLANVSTDAFSVTGVTIMVVEEGLLSQEEIRLQLSSAAREHDRNQTWRQANIVTPKYPKRQSVY